MAPSPKKPAPAIGEPVRISSKPTMNIGPAIANPAAVWSIHRMPGFRTYSNVRRCEYKAVTVSLQRSLLERQGRLVVDHVDGHIEDGIDGVTGFDAHRHGNLVRARIEIERRLDGGRPFTLGLDRSR